MQLRALRTRWVTCGVTLLSAVLALVAFADQEPTPVTLHTSLDQRRHTLRGGFGASWHAIEQPLPVVGDRSHGGSAWGGHPPAEDRRAWNRIYRHADWLGLDFIRVEVEQRMWQPERDQFTWDSPEMRILYRILDWCQRRGADVFLQNMWGNVDWNAFPEFRGDPLKRLHSGPCSVEDFAESLAALVEHLVRVKHYTCIQWLCLNNEPGYDWSWWQAPPNQAMPLRPALAATRRALDRRGLHIPLSAPDQTDLPAFKAEQVDFDEFIGAYDLHSYFARFDWMNGPGYPLAQAERHLRDWRTWAAAHGKPLFLTELGSMVYGWGGSDPGPATFEAALKDAELVVRALNAGVEAFNRWSFVNRGDLDGQWQMIDTWDPGKKILRKEFTPKPNAYFVYGLICRLTAKHSRLLACETRGGQLDGTNRVFAAALESPAGEVTILIVNDAPQGWPLRLELHGGKLGTLHKYQITAAQRDQPELQIRPLASFKPAKTGGVLTDFLPPFSLTIFSTYHLNPKARGVISVGLSRSR